MKEEILERGEAGFSVELKDGNISIYHCENHELLKSWKGSGNDWETIWNLFELLELTSK